MKPRALFCHPERSEGPGGADGAQTHPPRPLATLGVTLPLHWSALLGFLRSRLVPGESVEDDVYRRGDVSVRFDGRKLIVNSDDPEVLARVHRLFDVDADVRAIAKHFAKDATLAPLLARHPGIRVPGAWDPFEVCVRAIVGQQVSVAGATTIMTRIVTRYGTSPERIARARGTNPDLIRRDEALYLAAADAAG